MTVNAIRPGYHGDMKDTVDKFHGNQILSIGWDRNRLYATPMCIPVPPSMPFGALVEQVLPNLFDAHPQYARINWREVEWTRSGAAFTPQFDKSLRENELEHKAVIRFRTPELESWL